MKLLLLPLLAIVFGLSAFAQAPPPPPPAPANDYFPERWNEHSFAEFGFAARFPREPKKTIELASERSDPKLLATFGIENPRFLSYTVSISELKGLPADPAAAKSVLADWKRAQLAAAGPGAAEVASGPIKISGVDHEYVEIESSGKRLRRAGVLRGRAIYTIGFTAPVHDRAMKSKDGYREIAEAFFNSFRLLGEGEMFTSGAFVDDGPDAVWKEFRSENDGFSVLLPGPPRTVPSQVNTGFSKVRQNEYLVRGERLLFAVVVQDYAMNISDPKVQSDLFVQWQKGFEEIISGQNAETEPITFREMKGSSLRVEAPTSVILARAFFHKNRFYSLAVMYDRGLSGLREEKKLVDEASAKFFASFDIFVPKQVLDLIARDRSLPDGFFGTHTAGKYRNDHLGFSVNVPEGWVFSPSDDMKLLSSVGREEMIADNPEIAKRLNAREKAMFIISKYPLGTGGNPSLAVAVTIESTPKIDLLGTVRHNERVYGSITGSRITTHSSEYKVGGRSFAFFEREMTGGDLVLKQRLVITVVRNYVLYFVITYLDEADREPLMKSLASLNFK